MSIIRYRNKRYKKSVIAIISILMVLFIGVLIFRIVTMSQIVGESHTKETQVITSEIKEVKPNVIKQNTEFTDIRIHSYNNIKFSDKLTIGDYVDIRIRFENGMDFIILSKKKVVDLSFANANNNLDNSIWLEVSEEEILRMSSAFVDVQKLEGSQIYTIQYLNEIQNAAIANYPVTTEVRKLIDNDPNITKKSNNLQEYPYRNEIEESDSSLHSILDDETSMEGERSYSSSEEETNYTSLEVEQEDIVYLD